jgi:hypothetical protein
VSQGSPHIVKTGRLERSFFVFVKGRGTCCNWERNAKIWIDFRKSPRFSLTSPLSQLREKSSRPVFTMCGEPEHQTMGQISGTWELLLCEY